MLARDEVLQIWRPDIYFGQATVLQLPHSTMGVRDGKGEMLTVSNGGEVFWSRQARFTFSCQMTLEKLPFDTQRCAVLAGLYSQRAEEVQLVWRAGFDALPNWCGPSAAQPAWSVTRLEQGNELQSFTGLGNFTYSRATLAFTRYPNRFMLNYFATALIMVGAWHV